MRDLDREFDAYAILMDVAEGLLPLSPLSELAKCYNEETDETKTENNNDQEDETAPT